MSSPSSQPIIILASPRSYTSIVCAMIGQHPQAYGLPEVNLFTHETLGRLMNRATFQHQFLIHGLLRTVAQLYAGEQTTETIAMARRWINSRRDLSTGDVYRELAAKVASLHLVDKSPAYSKKRETLDRIEREFPGARYLYLLRNPIDQGHSMIQAPQGFMQLLASRSLDFSSSPPRVEPQHEWMNVQRLIIDFLATIPDERKHVLRGEVLTRFPETTLESLCNWLGMDWSPTICEAMLHPEESPYACVGPFGAQWGNNPGFQRSPHFRTSTKAPGNLERPLPWREENLSLFPEVKQLAQSLGYT